MPPINANVLIIATLLAFLVIGVALIVLYATDILPSDAALWSGVASAGLSALIGIAMLDSYTKSKYNGQSLGSKS